MRLLTAHVETRHRNVWRTSEELWRQVLNAVAHRSDWERVYIIEACVGSIVAFSRRSAGARAELAGLCERRCWRV